MQAAFGQSCSQEISRELGEKHYSKVSRLGKFGLATTLIYTTPIPLILAIYPNILMNVLGEQNESTQQILHYLAPIIFIGTIVDAARFNLLQQLRILGDVKGSSIVSSTFLALGMSTAAFLGLKTKLGIYGVAAGYTGGILFATSAVLYRWLNRIEPSAIEAFQEKPQTTNSNKDCCIKFFKMAPELSRGKSCDGTQMTQNPLAI